MFIRDSAAAVPQGTTPEGFLRLRASIGRTGLHDYRAEELGTPAPFKPGDRIRVYRPAEEVFDPASMASFAAKPVTDDHPPTMVDATNWRRYAIGHSGEAVVPDGDHLAADLFIADAAAADRARHGAELSNGYHADFVFEPGLTDDGQPYDAVQRNIRGNHIALVDAGRCGVSCRVGDADEAGGVPRAAGDQDAPAASRQAHEPWDERPHRDPPANLAAPVTPARAAPTDSGEACGCRHEPGADTAALDTLVAERAGVVEVARRLIGPAFDAAGRSTPAIRRLVVAGRLGREAVADHDDAYVAAAFDTLGALAPRTNPLAAHLSAGPPARGAPNSRDAALAARDHHLTSAWKGVPLHGDH